jgi:hypothetical protein
VPEADDADVSHKALEGKEGGRRRVRRLEKAGEGVEGE